MFLKSLIGRPRRQQAYRRANTSLTLSSIPGGLSDSDPDPYISCTSILDRFGSSGGSAGPDSSAINGNGTRKMSAGAIKDFLLGRRDPPPPPPPPLPSSHLNDLDDHIYPTTTTSSYGAPYESAIIEDLKISSVPRLQPKYSYLIGRTTSGHKTSNGGDTDFWRKSNAVSVVNNNPYQPSTNSTSGYASSSRRSSQQYPSSHEISSLADYDRPNYLSYTSASHKSYLNDTTPSSASSAAYEDRMNTALRKGAPTPSMSAGSSYNVKKSKSYGNFDSANRDYSFQVCFKMSHFEHRQTTLKHTTFKLTCCIIT